MSKRVFLDFCRHLRLGVVGSAVICALAAATAGTAPLRLKQISFVVAPMPSWVKPVKAPGDVGAGMESTGTVYLLVDRQENVDRSAFYYHEVRKITSETGVQNGASVSASFNPAFEKLSFHSIQVTRGGTTLNRLDRSRIKLLQNEKDEDRAVYDQSCTAQMILDDVRISDVIEFAYTIEGANPLKRGRYSTTYWLQRSFPVVRNVLRLVYSNNRKLMFLPQSGAAKPIVRTNNGMTELWYDAANVPGWHIEDDVPDDYWSRQRLAISEFQNWGELAKWALPLFDTEPPHSPEFDAEVTKLRAISDPENRVVTALQFVQDEIRYVAVRLWLGMQKPTAPDRVLERRFANNIDKAALLVSLLRAVGIDAAPALVSESYYGDVRRRLPSTDLFDHAIVQVQLASRTCWIDPARAASQRGPLSQVYVGQYGYALVLRPTTVDLTPFSPPPESWPVKKIVENFRVPAPENDADLEVISEYRGVAADRARMFFRENTREEIQKHYLQYYQRAYPEAKMQKAPWFEEIPGENACRVTESYAIPKIWQLNDDKNRYRLSLQPSEIYSALGSTISLQREDPLKIEYPTTVIEELNVEMFEEWPLDATGQSTETDFFRVRDEPKVEGSSLQFHYSYEALKNRIEVSEFAKFNEAIAKLKDMLGYTLRYQTPEQLKKSKPPTTFNWAVGAAALTFLGAATFLAYRLFRGTKLPDPKPPPIDAPARLNGIGGWLILLAIGHILQPIRFIKAGYTVLSTTIDTNSWRSLTDPIESTYHAWWAPTLLFEIFFNITALVFSALLIALFFTKRTAWPRVFVLFLLFGFVGAIMDTVFLDRIPSAADPIMKSLWSIVPIAFAASIWIPYALISKRVKTTFRY